LSFIILLNLLIRGILGINQTRLRKILAYSSINHIGWMLAPLISNEMLWAIYLAIYTLINFTLIVWFFFYKIFFLKQIFLLMRNNLLLKIFFSFNILSLGGLPPFLGFYPKWLIIESLINNQYNILAILIVTITLLTLYFYVRIIFSSIIFNSYKNNFFIKIPRYNYYIVLINYLALIGLLVCTILFNFL